MNKKQTVITLSITVLVVIFAAIWCSTTNKSECIVVQEEQVDVNSSAEPNKKYVANENGEYINNGVKFDFYCDDKKFHHSSKENLHLVGVNIGLTEATTDLNNPNVSYETYYEWLTYISEMNANCIRVFSVMPPQFYNALYDYNELNEEKLYLFQGIWFNENFMYDFDHAFDSDMQITKAMQRSARETLDIIHGNSDYTDYGEIIGAEYKKDVSKYVSGYILGLEWYPDFVVNTNRQDNIELYGGEYLTCKDNATPFESFLCEIGDYLITYEVQNYRHQTPLSFLNWSTTDPLSHPNEPFIEEDMVGVDTENIVANSSYSPGMFVAIDVYPYYPEFMNHSVKYLETGNTYKAYLSDLMRHYTLPVIIAEFGIPTSRGVAHVAQSGFNQGGVTEKQQGEMICSMMTDIKSVGCAGGLIFSWQDEWFKQTWNTIRYSSKDPSVRTPNLESAEQHYGLLAIEPGEEKVVTIDGMANDWNDQRVKWDEGYLYIAVDNYNPNEKLFIPISIKGWGSDYCDQNNLTFDRNVDFLVEINGQDNSRVTVDAYQDNFYYRYHVQREIYPLITDYHEKGSGLYNSIKQFVSNDMYLPQSKEYIEPVFYESGKLKFANENDDSQADFYFKDGFLEIRIPWYLLNVMNSATGTCLNDIHNDGDIAFDTFDEIYIGFGGKGENIKLVKTKYYPTNKVAFHTRLKESYYIIKDFLD